MRKLLLAGVVACFAMPGLAEDLPTLWAKQLIIEGYEDIEIRRTILGRIRIIATKDDAEREIILNPRTGEVLRDYFWRDDDIFRLPFGFEIQLGARDDS